MQIDPGGFELVSVDGEMALLIRLGRRATDPVPALGRVTRSFHVKEPDDATVGPFLAAETKRRAGARYRAGVLYNAYLAWCGKQGLDGLGLHQFHRAMRARGFKQVRSNGHWWRDLDVLDAAPAGLLL